MLSLLAWFFRRFAVDLMDGGYELVIRSGIYLDYFSGWVPYPNFEVNQVYVLLHVLGRTYSLYSVNLEYIEYEEFPGGEFRSPRWYHEREEDFWVQGVDFWYPDACEQCPYAEFEDCSSMSCPAPETYIGLAPQQ